MNTIIADVLNEIILNLSVVFWVALISLLLGWYFGSLNRIPVKRVRYFVWEDVLRKWTFGEKKTEMIFRDTNKWSRSSASIKQLLTNYQEIGALEAHRLFPNAFKK